MDIYTQSQTESSQSTNHDYMLKVLFYVVKLWIIIINHVDVYFLIFGGINACRELFYFVDKCIPEFMGQ